eukprot:tig00020904_g15263.t1
MTSQAAGPFDALPDGVMSDIFRALGLQASWALRAVGRRWRRVIQETEWASFAVPKVPKQQSGEHTHVLDIAATLVEEKKLRLSGGASVTIRTELPSCAGETLAAVDRSHQRSLAAVCRVLSAVTSRRSRPAAAFASSAGLPSTRPEVVVDIACVGGRVDGNFVRAYLLGVLRALRPAEGAATSGLESLSVGLTSSSGGGGGRELEGARWPMAGELEADLAVLGQLALRRLVLFFEDSDGVSRKMAATIAAACPLLRSLSLQPNKNSIPEVLAALAPLAHLEELVVVDKAFSNVARGLAALADGAAGQSLRSVAFVTARGCYKKGGFPERDVGAATAAACVLDEAALAALGRMPRLESIEPLQVFSDEDDAAPAAVLGRFPNLRQVVVRFVGGEDGGPTTAALRALAEAIDGLRRLQTLTLDLDCVHPVGDEGTVALLDSGAVQRALADLRLSIARPLSEAEAGAIAALPALRRLRVDAPLAYPPLTRPYEALHRLLRPGVAVELSLEVSVEVVTEALLGEASDDDDAADPERAVEEAIEAVEALFAGRRAPPE